MVKRVDVAVADAFSDQINGEWTSGIEVMGIANDGVGYSVDEHNEALITAAMKSRLDDLSAKIQSGEIQVHDYTTDSSCPVS